MKFFGLILSILGILAGAIIFVVSLMLPALTRNRVNLEEASPGLIFGAALFLVSFLATLLSLVLVLVSKNTGVTNSPKLQ